MIVESREVSFSCGNIAGNLTTIAPGKDSVYFVHGLVSVHPSFWKYDSYRVSLDDTLAKVTQSLRGCFSGALRNPFGTVVKSPHVIFPPYPPLEAHL
jgi:hypothetical protein